MSSNYTVCSSQDGHKDMERLKQQLEVAKGDNITLSTHNTNITNPSDLLIALAAAVESFNWEHSGDEPPVAIKLRAISLKREVILDEESS